ncbi:tRNase Z TRZ3, mitochondrial [Porphyridium purpureum]|uniref:ribonuclease Z n=1 Tax=Porphyridium purpureum TaxID=35688 RepID=A0A5J4YKW5_PORPP|nr:tRNase Z TRZ3, mitochondrial [Porphyridium purpureum]|eukprot:POR3681..scf249_10
MKGFLEVLGVDSLDTYGSLLLFFDEERYLFECGDGTQRLCSEYKVKVAHPRMRNIFLSTNTAQSLGGLFGMLLTLADAGKTQLAITAPSGIQQLFKASKPFIYRPSLKLDITEVDAPHQNTLPQLVSQDDLVSVFAVPLMSDQEPHILKAGSTPFVVSYICRACDMPGKFDAEAAQRLGIPPGPTYGRLKRGESVVLASGEVVTPQMVMSESISGSVILFARVPSVDYVQNFVAHDGLSPIALCKDERRARFVCVVHMAPREVLQDERYRAWCQALEASPLTSRVQHIGLHQSLGVGDRLSFHAQAQDTYKLHRALGLPFFPLPAGSLSSDHMRSVEAHAAALSHSSIRFDPPDLSAMSESRRSCNEALQALLGVPDVVLAETKLRLNLAPVTAVGLVYNETASLSMCADMLNDIEAEVHAVLPTPTAEKTSLGVDASEAVPHVMAPVANKFAHMGDRECEITFLGTAAAIPGKHRNVSAILLNMFERGAVLLDCGEGTLGQLTRSKGQQRADEILRRLKAVWISHMHADHHLGLLHVLSRCSQPQLGRTKPVMVLGPRPLQNWLASYSKFCENVSYLYFDNQIFVEPQQPSANYFPEHLGLRVRCVEVDHCSLSYGLVLDDCVHDWRLVYSGDTRPCRALAEAGKDALIAIHEATLENDMAQEAREKMHCTTSEAIDICVHDMNAYRTILTHFSQRYPRVPALKDSTELLKHQSVALAFDFMVVNFKDLDALPRLLHALPALFPDDEDGSICENNTLSNQELLQQSQLTDHTAGTKT